MRGAEGEHTRSVKCPVDLLKEAEREARREKGKRGKASMCPRDSMQGAGREGGGVGERKREEKERSEQVELNFPTPAGLVELLPARAVVGTVFLETVLGRLQTEYTQEALVLLFL